MGCLCSKQPNHNKHDYPQNTSYVPYNTSQNFQPSVDASHTYYDPNIYNMAYVSGTNNSPHPVYYSFHQTEQPHTDSTLEILQGDQPSFYHQTPLQPYQY